MRERRASLDLPGGSVRTEGGEILLRTIGQAYRGTEYENLMLRTRPDGTRLRLGEVATVVDGFAETDQTARFDGETTVLVSFVFSDRREASVLERLEGGEGLVVLRTVVGALETLPPHRLLTLGHVTHHVLALVPLTPLH